MQKSKLNEFGAGSAVMRLFRVYTCERNIVAYGCVKRESNKYK